MTKNFYKNPLSIVWKARKNLMPSYLVILWGIIFLTSIIGSFIGVGFDVSSLTLDNHFSLSSTVLALTLALFVAGKDVFSESELKRLAAHKNEDEEQGQALVDFLGPYVFTAILFFLTGVISLFGPFLNLNFSHEALIILKIVYLNILSLGFFSLFNLIIVMLNDVFMKAFRK